MTIKETILDIINSNSGIKAVDLIIKVSTVHPISYDEFSTEIEKLIHEGEIIELEYTLPDFEYRIKSIYFPKGTIITKNNQFTGIKE